MKSIIGLAGILLAVAAGAQAPRVALLLSADGRHHDEFDQALSTLGWPADRYPCRADSLAALAGKLGAYDMLLVAPLFNLLPQPLLPGPDRKAYRAFLEQGGLIAVTDGSYPGVRAWLADIDPRLGGLESGSCNSSQWAANGVTADAEPPHPLRFFPSRIREPNSWPHFLKLPPDTRWRTVAFCSEGYPATVAQPVGAGLVSVSALRQPSAKQLGNFYACLLLGRAGLALKSFAMPDPALACGTIRLTLDGGGPSAPCGFAYEILPESGSPQRFEAQVSGETFELPYRTALRGPVTARLLLLRGGEALTLFSRKAVLPPLLTVTPAASRGILSAARRLPAAGFEIGLAPDPEGIEEAMVRLTVCNAGGAPVAATNAALAAVRGFRTCTLAVDLSPSLPAGAYAVRAALFRGERRLAESACALTILAPRPAQTIVDEDNTLLVDGKPFFPLGLYHVSPDQYADVAALGINTVQFWAWDAQPDARGASRGLAAAAAHGLKAVFELNHKSAQIVRETAAAYRENPALLMWYGLDEPAEGSYGLAAELRDAFHACDDQHPVFTVSCRPDLFAEQAAFADVFAHDPYGAPEKAAEWMARSQAAVGDRKPVVCVLGVFGKESEAELRAAAYLALAQGARGLFWYPWCQTGGGPAGIGLKNSPAQQAVIRQLCAELRALAPALTAPVRQSFRSGDGKLCGLLCEGERRVLLLVNGTPATIESEAAVPGAESANAEWPEFFKARGEPLALREGRVRLTLAPYEVRVYADPRSR